MQSHRYNELKWEPKNKMKCLQTVIVAVDIQICLNMQMVMPVFSHDHCDLPHTTERAQEQISRGLTTYIMVNTPHFS